MRLSRILAVVVAAYVFVGCSKKDADPTSSTGADVITSFNFSVGNQKLLKVFDSGDGGFVGVANGEIEILANGSTPRSAIGLAKYTSAGVLDTAFGNGGMTTLVMNNDLASTVVATSSAQGGDGSIFVAGMYSNVTGSGIHASGTRSLFLAKYKSNGTLNTTFDGDGVLIVPLPASYNPNFISGVASVSDIAVQSDGKIFLSLLLNGIYPYVACLNADGSVDTSFGTLGFSQVTAPSSGPAVNLRRLLLLSSGKILGLGTFTTTTPVDLVLVRLNANGSLDSTFGTAGFVFPSDNHTAIDVGGLIELADGRILTAELARDLDSVTACSDGNCRAKIFKYLADGSVDTSFGANGVVTLSSLAFRSVRQLRAHSDGRLFVGGSLAVVNPAALLGQNSRPWDFAVVSLTANGAMDTGFGTDGIFLYDPTGDGLSNNELTDFTLINDHVVLGGNRWSAGYQAISLLRVSTGDAGTPVVVTAPTSVLSAVGAQGAPAYFMDFARDSSGNTFAAGIILQGSADFGNSVAASGSMVLVKYDAVGNALWAQSPVTVNPTSGAGGVWFNRVAVDTAGNSFAAGYISAAATVDFGNGVSLTTSGTGYNLILAKYNSAGQAQWAKLVVGDKGGAALNSVAVDASGNVYVGGYAAGFSSTYDFGNGVVLSNLANTTLIVAKYSTAGLTQWVKTSKTTGFVGSEVFSIAVDSSGNVYAAGSIQGANPVDFGDGVIATGTQTDNRVLIKYSTNGVCQWAETTHDASSAGPFLAVVLDSDENPNVFGKFGNAAGLSFGNGISVTGKSTNTVYVKYNSAGIAQKAFSLISEANVAEVNSIGVDSLGRVYAAGSISTGRAFTSRFDTAGALEERKVVSSFLGASAGLRLLLSPDDHVYVMGSLGGSDFDYNFGAGVTVNETASATGISFIVDYLVQDL